MKRFILLSCLILLSANAFAKDKSEFDVYKEKMQKCDAVFSKEANNAVTTADQRKAGYNAKDCYVKVGNDVIDKYYSKNSTEMKRRLTEFIKSNYAITAYIHQMHDDCTPACGSIGTVFYVDSTANYVKEMIKEIINGADEYHLNKKR